MKTKKTEHFFRITGRIDNTLSSRFEIFCSKIPPNDRSQTIYLLFHSRGGDLGAACKIVEILNKLSATVITVSYGIVHSSALPIFASGKVRLAKNLTDSFFFHRATSNKDVSQKGLLSSEHSAFSYIADSIGATIDSIYELADNNSYIDAIQAKKMGLVHKIIKTKSAA